MMIKTHIGLISASLGLRLPLGWRETSTVCGHMGCRLAFLAGLGEFIYSEVLYWGQDCLACRNLE